MLRDELDAFFDDAPQLRHQVTVSFDGKSKTAVVLIERPGNRKSPWPVKVVPADSCDSELYRRAQELVREKRSQWLYFERNLRVYEGTAVALLKPLQRIQWLRSQALLDADTIIAEKLTS